jgi:hypothetical protein
LDKHPLVIAKNEGKKSRGTVGKATRTRPDADAKSPGLSMAAISKHFLKIETMASDPTQAQMAQLLKNFFQGKV